MASLQGLTESQGCNLKQREIKVHSCLVSALFDARGQTQTFDPFVNLCKVYELILAFSFVAEGRVNRLS